MCFNSEWDLQPQKLWEKKTVFFLRNRSIIFETSDLKYEFIFDRGVAPGRVIVLRASQKLAAIL